MTAEPADTVVSDHYKGAAGAHYTAHHQSDPYSLGYQLDLAYFRPWLQPEHQILDFGCGNGGLLRLLNEVAARADGLEVNPHAAATARKNGMHVYPGLEALPGGLCYDRVVSNHVLEHIRDVAGTLEQLRGNIKPGGLLLLKLPMEDWRARDQRRVVRDDIDHHLQTWTPKLIGNVLFEAGYEVEQVRVVTSAWHPKLFPLVHIGLGSIACWALAVWKKRRQLFVVARAPA